MFQEHGFDLDPLHRINTSENDKYGDNKFSNIPLFCILGRYGIATCRTVRRSSALYPTNELYVNKVESKIPWGTMAGVAKHDVFVLLWLDEKPVQFLTAAFTGGLGTLR